MHGDDSQLLVGTRGNILRLEETHLQTSTRVALQRWPRLWASLEGRDKRSSQLAVLASRQFGVFERGGVKLPDRMLWPISASYIDRSDARQQKTRVMVATSRWGKNCALACWEGSLAPGAGLRVTRCRVPVDHAWEEGSRVGQGTSGRTYMWLDESPMFFW